MGELALTVTLAKPALDVDQVAALGARFAEPAPLLALRQRALDVYRASALPDRALNRWRFTDPRDLLPSALGPLPALVPAAVMPEVPAAGAAVLLQPGVRPRWAMSQPARQAGVTIVPLADATPWFSLIGSAVGADHGLFEALDLAAFGTGVAVVVPPAVALDGPIHLRIAAQGAAAIGRVLIVVGAGASASVVEEYVDGADGALIAVSELFADVGASVQHVLLQQLDDAARGQLTQRARLERDAGYVGVCASLGGRQVRVDLGAQLIGSGSHSELIGVVLGDGRQRFDHHTVQLHQAPNTSSNIDFKAALGGHANSTYSGLIRISTAATGSTAYQENRNLLLSPDARAQTTPELEILTDDVSCTHGATVAPVDAEQLFYLRSRGLDPTAAVRLVVRGFLERTLAQIPAALRPPLELQIEQRLLQLTTRQP